MTTLHIHYPPGASPRDRLKAATLAIRSAWQQVGTRQVTLAILAMSDPEVPTGAKTISVCDSYQFVDAVELHLSDPPVAWQEHSAEWNLLRMSAEYLMEMIRCSVGVSAPSGFQLALLWVEDGGRGHIYRLMAWAPFRTDLIDLLLIHGWIGAEWAARVRAEPTA